MFDFLFFTLAGRHAYWWEWIIVAAVIVVAVVLFYRWAVDNINFDP